VAKDGPPAQNAGKHAPPEEVAEDMDTQPAVVVADVDN